MDENTREHRTLLDAVNQGDGLALDQLIELVYGELRQLAGYHLRNERSDHTLQPTALVHEVFLKLFEGEKISWHSKRHFFRVANRQIRRVLVDHARARNRRKRSGNLLRVTLNEEMAADFFDVDILSLDAALDKLDAQCAEDRQIVELKFFSGLTEEEIASLLEISDRTVRRRWTFARAWLYRELQGQGHTNHDE